MRKRKKQDGNWCNRECLHFNLEKNKLRYAYQNRFTKNVKRENYEHIPGLERKKIRNTLAAVKRTIVNWDANKLINFL